MGFLNRFFGGRKGTKNKKATKDIMTIAKPVSAAIDQTAQDIFESFHTVLLTEKITYIVFAVWGADKNGPLTETQKKIYGMVNPQVQSIRKLFGSAKLSLEQEYTIEYLIRGLIISKITFMIEFMKNNLTQETTEKINTAGTELNDPFPIDIDNIFNQDNTRKGRRRW
jgi:hypothetical protein